MEPYMLTIPKGIQKNPLFQHKGEEMMMILEGSMRFLHGEKEYLLEQGDCIYFDSGVPHKGFGVMGERVKCLVVIHKP